MKEAPTLQIVESDVSQVKLDERVQLAIDSDSFSEYQMKCEVHGVEPKTEKEWWIDHCGGFTVEFSASDDMLKCLNSPKKIASDIEFKTEFRDSSVTNMFNSWMRTHL